MRNPEPGTETQSKVCPPVVGLPARGGPRPPNGKNGGEQRVERRPQEKGLGGAPALLPFRGAARDVFYFLLSPFSCSTIFPALGGKNGRGGGI